MFVDDVELGSSPGVGSLEVSIAVAIDVSQVVSVACSTSFLPA